MNLDKLVEGFDASTRPLWRRILIDWNDTATPNPVGSVPELFEQRARMDPDSVAVVHGSEALT